MLSEICERLFGPESKQPINTWIKSLNDNDYEPDSELADALAYGYGFM